MLDAPTIVKTTAQHTAAIRLRVAWNQMQAVMGPGVAEVTAAVAAQGIAATGPWFNHHFRAPTDTFDFEICVPVATSVKPAGRVRPSELPAATVARAVHHGNYDGLGAAWGQLRDWIAANGRATRADFWEVYVVGPDASADPADWRTQLNWPLAAS
jgi:effector-binding domain-containing protein